MKYIDEYRDSALAHALARAIKQEVQPGKSYRLMEFCGGHTHAIFRYSLPELLPNNIQLIHGPGCPVCVLPIARIDAAIELVKQHGVTLCTYGDMLRVPGSRKQSLMTLKTQGADIRMVYSATDALTIAQNEPDKNIVFFAIGFETTTPPTAAILLQAQSLQIQNFSVLCNHVLTPPALNALLAQPANEDNEIPLLDGFIGPAHVSTVIGSEPYRPVAEVFNKPLVIAGFEPLDLLQSILMLVKQINEGRAEVENEFTRAVTPHGNVKAQQLVAKTMKVRDEFEWRGLGMLPKSGLKIKSDFQKFDAETLYPVALNKSQENKACQCPRVLKGLIQPSACPLFAKQCTPETPLGSCMVSSEGACAAHYNYGRNIEAMKEAIL
jgi:hydrogenase expression/formation protein HypD